MDTRKQFTVLSGIRIQILAQAIACKTAFARELHERLAKHLKRICNTLSFEIAVAARFGGEDEAALGWEGPGEIHLIDSVYIDHPTGEYQINGETWYSFDGDGEPIATPATAEQTEGLDRFISELADYGVRVTAHFVSIRYEERLAA
jgi:hypothetical protein